MIAHLFHAPIGEDDTAVGVGTVGSSEAIMLAGIQLVEDGMNQEQKLETVDENMICVAAIFGFTMTREFEDVKLLNDLLMEKNNETMWDTPVHAEQYTMTIFS
ncbi:glutamate decarboxylase [Tanacetum coccineum]